MAPEVLYEVSDSIATITLNRPDRLNAMNEAMLAGVMTALEDALSDDLVRVIVLTGAGRAFCVGGDVEGMASGSVGGLEGDAPSQHHVNHLRHGVLTSHMLVTSSKPTIAAINGACAGAGLSWACAADLRYCHENAIFTTGFVNVGLSGDFGGTWTLPRIIGSAKARELYLTGARFSSEEAFRLGLVSAIYSEETFLESVRAQALALATKAPLALAEIKANLNDGAYLSFADLLDRESARHVRIGLTADAREAAQAFIEKRQPTFYGR